jgi:hypothetical protein
VLTPGNRQSGLPLDRLIGMLGKTRMVTKHDLRPGDLLEVVTRNSRYTIRVLDDDRYQVSGGWFERRHGSPVEVAIKGCTWGGSTIKVDVIAACGLCIEFGNRVTTSAVQRIIYLPHEIGN